MASLFERQRADVESRLDAIVRGGEPVTSRALASLQGALGLDDVILDDEGVPRDAPGSDTRALVEHALCRLTQRVMQEEAEGGGEAGPGSTTRRFHTLKKDPVPGAGAYNPVVGSEAEAERDEGPSSAFALLDVAPRCQQRNRLCRRATEL